MRSFTMLPRLGDILHGVTINRLIDKPWPERGRGSRLGSEYRGMRLFLFPRPRTV